MAETQFGVQRGSFLLLAVFVVAFGVLKAAMNFVAGRMSEKVGRKRVLIWGWMVALPIPLMIWYAPYLELDHRRNRPARNKSGPLLVDDADG